MDIATLIGIIAGICLVFFGIVFDEATGINIGALTGFIDIPSVIITIGGTLSALLTSYKLKDYINNLKCAGVAFKDPKLDLPATITRIIELSNVARKEGLLALEEVADGLEDQFMKKGILLIVDGTEPELVRGILETEMDFMDERHGKVQGFWDNVAAMGPAWGMIGTLIGLVNMLGALDDPSTIGPAMAVALITTLYGSLLANWIATPLSNKMKAIGGEEYQSKALIVEGLLSIQAGENPRVIEEKLKSFLSPKSREGVSSDDAGAGAGAGGED